MALQQEVSQLIRIAVANQPNYIWNQLKALGYNSNQFSPTGAELEAGLFSLYNADKNAFYGVLTSLPFDETKTDAINSTSLLRNLAIETGLVSPSSNARFNWGDLWKEIVKTVAGHEQTVVDPTVVTTSKISIGAIIGLSVVAILIVVVAYFAFFRKS